MERCLVTRYIYCMTANQLAVAAGAEIKWLVNSAALLRKRLRYTARDAKWWGLVRLLTENPGLSLKAAAEAATSALKPGDLASRRAVSADASHSASVLIDLARYGSIFLANLSRALLYDTPKRKGRPPRRVPPRAAVRSALDYGVDLGLVRSALARSPAERLALLEANVAFVKAVRRAR